MDKLISWSLVVVAIYTIYVVVTPNHLFIG
jgi:hypothetical protein